MIKLTTNSFPTVLYRYKDSASLSRISKIGFRERGQMVLYVKYENNIAFVISAENITYNERYSTDTEGIRVEVIMVNDKTKEEIVSISFYETPNISKINTDIIKEYMNHLKKKYGKLILEANEKT